MATLNGQLIVFDGPDQGAAEVPGQLIIREGTTQFDQNDLFRSYDSPNYVFARGAPPTTGVNPVLIGRRCG